MILQERVEFGDKLREIAEGEEAPIQCPRRTGHWLLGGKRNIILAAREDYSLVYCLLTGAGVSVYTGDCRLRNAIEEAKATFKCQWLRAPKHHG